MPAVRLASFPVERMDLQLPGNARAVFPIVRTRVEHIFHARTMSGLRPPVAVDVVSSL
jgi:hypothetical protein